MGNSNDELNNFRAPEMLENIDITHAPALPGVETVIRGDAILRTPHAGNVRALMPPPLPQAPFMQTPAYAARSTFGGQGMYGGHDMYSGAYGGLGIPPYGNTFGAYGGLAGYGGAGGGYSRFGSYGNNSNPLDPSARFLQLAESTSRPAFESIESLVSTVSHIAAMLDSTYFALTSSFRAVLGMAANFTQLRSVLGQVLRSFTIFRSLNWLYSKILHWLRISNLDPSTAAFKQAFSEAVNNTQNAERPKQASPWPVLAFVSFILTAPYLIMKLVNTVSDTAQDAARNPSKWIAPLKANAQYDFQARSSYELSLRAGDSVLVAPREVHATLGLLNSSWALATVDGRTSGLVPLNYLQLVKPAGVSEAQQSAKQQQQQT